MSKAKLRAEAINRFVTDAKAQGVYSSLKAACIMTGWDTLAGALTPLVGSAPTNSGFVAADYDRGGQGLKGDASSKYLNSNRANNADGQSDHHIAVHVSSPTVAGGGGYERYCGVYDTSLSPSTATNIYQEASGVYAGFSRNNIAYLQGTTSGLGIAGVNRSDSASFSMRIGGATTTASATAYTPASLQSFIFCGNLNGSAWRRTNARLSWYSIGSSVDLSALDTLVTRLMADLRAIEEDGMDRDALAYCRAVEAQDGSFMVTGVKQAVDRLVKGLKYDKDSNGRSAWDAIGASCLFCGPRTIAGALVPLKGVAPTAYNFVSANYNQETGLVGDGATKYLDSNFSPSSLSSMADAHIAVYRGAGSFGNQTPLGLRDGTCWFSIDTRGDTRHQSQIGSTVSAVTGVESDFTSARALVSTRQSQSNLKLFGPLGEIASSTDATTLSSSNMDLFVFARNDSGAPSSRFGGSLSFYSLGRSLTDQQASGLISRITKYVSDVAAAIP